MTISNLPSLKEKVKQALNDALSPGNLVYRTLGREQIVSEKWFTDVFQPDPQATPIMLSQSTTDDIGYHLYSVTIGLQKRKQGWPVEFLGILTGYLQKEVPELQEVRFKFVERPAYT